MKMSQDLEYRSLPIVFYILTFAGVWCPRDWKISSKKLYKFYAILQSMAGFSFWLSIFINIIITKNDSAFFYENIFAISSLSYGMYKNYFVLKNRKAIMNLMHKYFNDEWFKPRDNDEIQNVKKYQHEKRWVTQLYALGIVIGLTMKAITPMIKSDASWEYLPIEAWYPYDTTNRFCYVTSYVHQLVGGIPVICLHISVDSLFVGLVLQICTQLKIFRHRLENCANSLRAAQTKNEKLSKEVYSDIVIANLAHKHARILKFGKQVNTEFESIMSGQLMVTIPNICVNVYLLSTTKGITLLTVNSFLCLVSCLMQIFLYCWYGNKAILHSVDVVGAAYNMDWLFFNISTRKKILMIMTRTTRSIKFATGGFVMNIDSFIMIVKTSYSAFRLLQKM